MLLLADLVLPAPLREAAADERFALEVLRLEAAELRLAEEDPATLLREEEAADERLELEELRLVVPRPFLVTVAFLSR